MILTNCAACAAPLAHDAPRCVRCETRYCSSTCQHPRTTVMEGKLQECRAAGLARMPAEPRFDKAARARNPAKGLVHYFGRLEKARRRGNARKIAKFGRKVQKYNQLAVAAVETW